MKLIINEEISHMKRVSVKVSMNVVNKDDPKDTVDTVIAYGDMSLEAYQALQRAVAESLLNLGDAAVEMHKTK